ncbi:hypothetical protein F5Y15DRAFT_297748 [Xylariaceae sp. FL0016]|nr:hypothetical protein F5Y15DRAFT_297748 [Xylariaceae sp. FL0016]
MTINRRPWSRAGVPQTVGWSPGLTAQRAPSGKADRTEELGRQLSSGRAPFRILRRDTAWRLTILTAVGHYVRQTIHLIEASESTTHETSSKFLPQGDSQQVLSWFAAQPLIPATYVIVLKRRGRDPGDHHASVTTPLQQQGATVSASASKRRARERRDRRLCGYQIPGSSDRHPASQANEEAHNDSSSPLGGMGLPYQDRYPRLSLVIHIQASAATGTMIECFRTKRQP